MKIYITYNKLVNICNKFQIIMFAEKLEKTKNKEQSYLRSRKFDAFEQKICNVLVMAFATI